VRKLIFIFFLISFFGIIPCTASDDLYRGRICHESFEPIRRYEAEFQKAIEKDPKLFALILVSIFHKLPHNEMMRMFEYVEEDLTFNKVDSKDAAKVFKYALYWAFVNELGEQETNQIPTKEQLKEIEKEIDKEVNQ